MFKTKKADARWISPYMFAVWGLVAVAVVIGLWMFNSKIVDVRIVESKILEQKIADCILQSDFFNKDIKEIEKGFDVFQNCGLSEKIINDSENFYILGEVVLSDRDIKIFEGGVRDFKTKCDLQKSSNAKNWAKCFEKKYPIIYNKKNAELIILTASNQLGDRF